MLIISDNEFTIYKEVKKTRSQEDKKTRRREVKKTRRQDDTHVDGISPTATKGIKLFVLYFTYHFIFVF